MGSSWWLIKTRKIKQKQIFLLSSAVKYLRLFILTWHFLNIFISQSKKNNTFLVTYKLLCVIKTKYYYIEKVEIVGN